MAQLVPEYSRQQADDGIDNDHRRYLAPVEDKIPHADFFRFENIDHSLVEPFVPATEDQQAIRCRQILGKRLVEPSALRCHDQPSCPPRVEFFNLFHAGDCRPNLQQHAGTSTERSIVYFMVFGIFGPCSQTMEHNLDNPTFNRLVEETLGQITFEDRREQGDNVKTHQPSAAGAPWESSSLGAAAAAAGFIGAIGLGV